MRRGLRASLAAALLALGCGYYGPPVRPDPVDEAAPVTGDTADDTGAGQPRTRTEEDGG